MDQIENLAKSGNRDQAQELLSQLEDMMNNLQAGRQQQRGQNGQQTARCASRWTSSARSCGASRR